MRIPIHTDSRHLYVCTHTRTHYTCIWIASYRLSPPKSLYNDTHNSQSVFDHGRIKSTLFSPNHNVKQKKNYNQHLNRADLLLSFCILNQTTQLNRKSNENGSFNWKCGMYLRLCFLFSTQKRRNKINK